MPQIDYHMIIKPTNNQYMLVNLHGSWGHNKMLSVTTKTKDQKTNQLKKQTKVNDLDVWATSNHQNASAFLDALMDRFNDENTVKEIARAWNVTQEEINKHFNKFWQETEKGNAETAREHYFWQTFYANAFAECVALHGAVTTEMLNANEDQLKTWLKQYEEAAREQFNIMLTLHDKEGVKAYDNDNYIKAQAKLIRISGFYWQTSRRLGLM